MHTGISVIEGLESRTLFSSSLSGLISSLVNSSNPAVQADVKKVEADLVVVNANTQGLQTALAPYTAQVATITKTDRAAIATDLSNLYADRHSAKARVADKKKLKADTKALHNSLKPILAKIKVAASPFNKTIKADEALLGKDAKALADDAFGTVVGDAIFAELSSLLT